MPIRLQPYWLCSALYRRHVLIGYPPFGVNTVTTAVTLPKQIAYCDPRLQPPPGYEDTTVPGVWSRGTVFSYGNHDPGWVTAPGVQGVDVQPFTANMLTPESLSELMGGPDAAISQAPPAFGAPPGGNLPGPPDAYSENNPLPPPWYQHPVRRRVPRQACSQAIR
jgi:phospholipid/cholesterol/gamma-HCH transport system substrate-binding protein